ncbi:hypothetical protein AUR66_11585, partial [Haloferax profundi]
MTSGSDTQLMNQGRDDSGRFVNKITDQDILKVFDYNDDPVLTAPEVAEGLHRFDKQMTSEGVRNRLEKMAEDGLVNRKKIGSRAVCWWAEVAPEIDSRTA